MKQLLKDYDSKSVDIFISYLDILKTEKDKDARYIGKLHCPKDCDMILVLETTESTLKRVFNKD